MKSKLSLAVLVLTVLIFSSTSCDEAFTDSTPPVVTIINPESNSVSTVEILKAEVSDEGGIDLVNFFINGELVGSVVEPPYQLDWNFQDGEPWLAHIIIVTAIDMAGNVGQSETRRVYVEPDDQTFPVKPHNLIPAHNTIFNSIKPQTLSWSGWERMILSEVIMSDTEGFTDTLFHYRGTDLTIPLPNDNSAWYYWKVRGKDVDGRWSRWTDAHAFHIGDIYSKIIPSDNKIYPRYFTVMEDASFMIGALETSETYESWPPPKWLNVMKVDIHGEVIWSTKELSANGNWIFDESITADGGAMLVAKHDTGDHSHNTRLVKLDPSGNEEWEKIISPFGGVHLLYSIHALTLSTDGGYLITGGVVAGLDGSPTYGWYNLFLWKIDASGEPEWDKVILGPGSEHGVDVVSTSGGGYIIQQRDHYDFAAPLVRIDADGNVLWQAEAGNSGDIIDSFHELSDGSIIATGRVDDSGTKFLLIKLDADGNRIFRSEYSEDSFNTIHDARETADGGYIMTGESRAESSGVNSNMWLIKTDSQGIEQWREVIAQGSSYAGMAVAQTEDGGYFVVGTNGEVGFQVGTIRRDLWFLKTDPQGKSVIR